MKNILLCIVAFLSVTASAQPYEMKDADKAKVCKKITSSMFLANRGLQISEALCISGEWSAYNPGTRERDQKKIAFSWRGLVALYQTRTNSCEGILLTFPNSQGRPVTEVFNLSCK